MENNVLMLRCNWGERYGDATNDLTIEIWADDPASCRGMARTIVNAEMTDPSDYDETGWADESDALTAVEHWVMAQAAFAAVATSPAVPGQIKDWWTVERCGVNK